MFIEFKVFIWFIGQEGNGTLLFIRDRDPLILFSVPPELYNPSSISLLGTWRGI